MLWLAATMLALPIAANAQPVTGLYVGAGVGPDFQLNQDVKNLQLGAGVLGGLSTSGKKKFSTGFAGLASVGYGLGNGLRAEVEGNYPSNQRQRLHRVHPLRRLRWRWPAAEIRRDGQRLYDFVGLIPVVQPYVGAGVGFQWVDNNIHAYNVNQVTLAGTHSILAALRAASSGTKAVFAYQAIVGAAIPIDAVPGLALTAEYRFLGTAGNTADPTTFKAVSTGGAARVAPGSTQFGPTYDNSVLFGVRYNFGVAPPPPAPVPAAGRPVAGFPLVPGVLRLGQGTT